MRLGADGDTEAEGSSSTIQSEDAVRLDVCTGDRPAALTAEAVAFADTYCEEIAAVDDLYELLRLPVATAAQLEVLRISVCTSDAPVPDRDQSEAAFELFVRTTAEQDATLATQWLDAGVLTSLETTARDDGSVVDDLEVDEAAVARLADAEQGLFAAVAADVTAFCTS